MNVQPDLNLVRLFITVVQTRTLSEAARRLNMTRSNASRQLKALEVAVGAQLLRRTTRHTEVTEAGQLLYAHGLRMIEELEAAQAAIDSLGQTVRGDVRIRLPTGIGHFYLTRVLLEFARDYPDVALRVLINDYIGDLVNAEVDVALKITSSPPEDHVARKIADIVWCLCATPAYLNQHPNVRHVNDLQNHTLITPASLGRRFDLKLDFRGTPLLVRVSPRLQSGDYPYLLQATLADLGIALLPRYAVWQPLEDGRLREVLPDYIPEGVGNGAYLLTAPNRFPTLATRTLIEYLTRQLQVHQPYWAASYTKR